MAGYPAIFQVLKIGVIIKIRSSLSITIRFKGGECASIDNAVKDLVI